MSSHLPAQPPAGDLSAGEAAGRPAVTSGDVPVTSTRHRRAAPKQLKTRGFSGHGDVVTSDSLNKHPRRLIHQDMLSMASGTLTPSDVTTSPRRQSYASAPRPGNPARGLDAAWIRGPPSPPQVVLPSAAQARLTSGKHAGTAFWAVKAS